MERSCGKVFSGFEEGAITFLPTYKYDIGTSIFDTSEKRRSPSWCDRILWFKHPSRRDKTWLTQKWYRSSMELLTSDHKPIKSLFEVKIRSIKREALGATQSLILRALDKLENESIPLLTLSTNTISFGEMKYLIPLTKTLVLENKGQAPAQWRFIDRSPTDGICQKWLWCEPKGGVLQSKEKQNIHFTIYVESHLVSRLMSGDERLEDILILRVDNGKDAFISVQADFVPTCFGVSLTLLSLATANIRDLGLAGLLKLHSEPLNLGRRITIPRQVWRMVDFLYRYGMNVDSLFFCSGDTVVCAYLRDCLDTGTEFDIDMLMTEPEDVLVHSKVLNHHGPPLLIPMDSIDTIPSALSSHRNSSSAEIDYGLLTNLEHLKLAAEFTSHPSPLTESDTRIADEKKYRILRPPRSRCGLFPAVHSMAESLIRWLEALPDPIIPNAWYDRCVSDSGTASFHAAKTLIGAIPTSNNTVLLYLTTFLKEIIARRTDPRLPEKLGTRLFFIVL